MFKIKPGRSIESKILENDFMSRFAEEAHSEFSQTSNMELLAKIVNV